MRRGTAETRRAPGGLEQSGPAAVVGDAEDRLCRPLPLTVLLDIDLNTRLRNTGDVVSAR